MYGLVFRVGSEIFLSEYDSEGNISDGEAITDDKQVYKDLTENDISFVEIERYQQDVQYLRDLRKISISNEDPTKTFLDLLKEGGGPDLAKLLWQELASCTKDGMEDQNA